MFVKQVRNVGVIVAGAVVSGMAMAQATAEAAIGQAQTEILAIVATAGAAFIAVALAGVGWSVGAKFIKRIGGKA